MALRLKYAEINESRITIVSGCNCKEIVRLVEPLQRQVFILLTYTAMLKLRREIVKNSGIDFWEQ